MRAIHLPSDAERGWPARNIAGPAFAFFLLLSFVPGALPANNPYSPVTGQNQALNAEEFRIKAAYQYDLAKFYLENGETEKAVDAIRQIIQSRIPPQYEETVTKSVCESYFADKLKDLRRFDLAQPLLDDLLKVVTQIPNRVTILKSKSKLYYLADDNDKAIEFWKRAEAEARRKK
jgi:tetratricopeptide (TPR) repeat protein